jgi:spore cortex biosynthesis protein YabQ
MASMNGIMGIGGLTDLNIWSVIGNRAEWQAVQLGLCFVLGLALGLFYDVYRVWFRSERRGGLRGLGDVCWWLAALLLVVLALYRINGLELRLPSLAAIAAGVCLHLGLLSPHVYPLLYRLFRAVFHLLADVCRLMARLLTLLLTPFVLVVEMGFRLLLVLRAVLKWLGRLICRLTAPIRKLIRKILARPARFGLRILRKIKVKLQNKKKKHKERTENAESGEKIAN